MKTKQISPNTDWDDLYSSAHRGEIRFTPSALHAVIDYARTKITHYFNSPEDLDDYLDNEYLYDVNEVDRSSQLSTGDLEKQRSSRFPFNAIASTGNCNTQLILKIHKAAGRASIYRSRNRYFAPLDASLTPEEAQERNQRSRDANARKAFRSAADEAVSTCCLVWTTLTFDDQHRTKDPQGVFEGFKRRLRERYERKTGKALKYVAVVAHDEQGREHAHALFSHDVDPHDIQESWNHGQVNKITTIEESEIEEKVGYMAKNIKHGRVTIGRFIRSRTEHEPVEEVPVDDAYEAREVLEDLIYPHVPRVVQTRLFGRHTNISFRFPPIRNEETE
jgi:hypothetical protein